MKEHDSWVLADLFFHYSALAVPEKSTTYLKSELVPSLPTLDLESTKGKEVGGEVMWHGKTALIIIFFPVSQLSQTHRFNSERQVNVTSAVHLDHTVESPEQSH